jgi:exonuclease VII large subunit
MRDFERRFSQMEERLAKATHDLRDETNKRLESLERFFEKELDALKSRLKTESDERTNDDKSLDDAVKSAANALKKNIAQVEERLSDQASEFRQQLLEQSKTLSSEIQSKNEKSAADLNARAGALDEAKIDRSTMAEYLIEMAMRLSNHSSDGPDAGQEA